LYCPDHNFRIAKNPTATQRLQHQHLAWEKCSCTCFHVGCQLSFQGSTVYNSVKSSHMLTWLLSFSLSVY